jgi:acetylornithine deacetylase/succinyl-diaminopimelate desuccinylase-like protein
VKLSAYERKQMAKVPFNEAKFRKSVGVALFGEAGYTPDEQRAARPTFEINGLTSGYQGEGGKTIIPSWASAKITMRLVPDQDPKKIIALVKKHLKAICPPTVKLTITEGQGGGPTWWIPPGHWRRPACGRRKPVLVMNACSPAAAAAFRSSRRSNNT